MSEILLSAQAIHAKTKVYEALNKTLSIAKVSDSALEKIFSFSIDLELYEHYKFIFKTCVLGK